MPDDWVNNAVADVLEGLNEERSRTRTGFNPEAKRIPQVDSNLGPQGEHRWRMRDPDATPSHSEIGDFGSIWRMLPALKDIPNELLRSLPLSTVLLQLNEALA